MYPLSIPRIWILTTAINGSLIQLLLQGQCLTPTFEAVAMAPAIFMFECIACAWYPTAVTRDCTVRFFVFCFLSCKSCLARVVAACRRDKEKKTKTLYYPWSSAPFLSGNPECTVCHLSRSLWNTHVGNTGINDITDSTYCRYRFWFSSQWTDRRMLSWTCAFLVYFFWKNKSGLTYKKYNTVPACSQAWPSFLFLLPLWKARYKFIRTMK